jgi:hypothetical protein
MMFFFKFVIALQHVQDFSSISILCHLGRLTVVVFTLYLAPVNFFIQSTHLILYTFWVIWNLFRVTNKLKMKFRDLNVLFYCGNNNI